MRGPIIIIVACVAALGLVRGARAEACTAPTRACAQTLPPRAAEPPPAPPRPAKRVPPGAQRRAFLQLYARTAECMRQGTVAMIQGGMRGREPITEWTINTCGRPMFEWFLREEHASKEEAGNALIHMADKAYDSALRGPDSVLIFPN